MGTPFENIYDRFLMKIQDWKLDKLAIVSKVDFYIFLKGLLINSIDLFNGCLTDLSYEDKTETVDGIQVTNTYFVQTLTSKEQSILSTIVMYSWMEREVNDVRQFSLHLSTRDFEVKSEQANLKQKVAYLNIIGEKYAQEITEYQLQNLNKIPFFGGN